MRNCAALVIPPLTSACPAYVWRHLRVVFAGIASLTISPNSSNAAWKVLRTGTGSVKSMSGRWSDFSSIDITSFAAADAAGAATQPAGQIPAAAEDTAAGTGSSSSKLAAAAPARLYFGVQWSQREVVCGESAGSGSGSGSSSGGGGSGELEYEPVCAMPAPWIGQLDGR